MDTIIVDLFNILSTQLHVVHNRCGRGGHNDRYNLQSYLLLDILLSRVYDFLIIELLFNHNVIETQIVIIVKHPYKMVWMSQYPKAVKLGRKV